MFRVATEEHPIETWDQLVHVTLYPKNLLNAVSDIESIQRESGKAKESLRSYLLHETLARKSKEEISTFVELNQGFCTELLNTIYSYQAAEDTPARFQKLYEQILADLESALLFLRKNLGSYFNKNGKVPDSILADFEKGFRIQSSGIKKRLGDWVADSLFSVLESLIQPSQDGLSYRQMDYLENLLAVLSSWNSPIITGSKLPPLFELLISLKFNDEGFLRLVFDTVNDQLSSIESEEEKIRLVRELYKHISQLTERPVDAFVFESNSAKETIMDWLIQETDYLESCLPKKEVNSSIAPSAKINTSLSVPVLALYIRLFKEYGIITNSNHQELFRAVCSTFTTHRKAEVAHSHLHSKFYAIEESARRKVFDQLMEMAHLCKRVS